MWRRRSCRAVSAGAAAARPPRASAPAVVAPFSTKSRRIYYIVFRKRRERDPPRFCRRRARRHVLEISTRVIRISTRDSQFSRFHTTTTTNKNCRALACALSKALPWYRACAPRRVSDTYRRRRATRVLEKMFQPARRRSSTPSCHVLESDSMPRLVESRRDSDAARARAARVCS